MDIYCRPWRLIQNRIRIEGGREIDKFRGIEPARDIQNGAEAWVGSVTKANGTTKENPYLGCSEMILPDGTRTYLFEAIAKAPEMILGAKHIEVYGQGLGMLVKLLDAKMQFLLQCHPARPVAKTLWNSDYGKEECWYVLGVREDSPTPPHILIGFKEGISREDFEAAYRQRNLRLLEEMCHKITVVPGESYFISGGMPHALGAGCFVAEIQEPSDLTAVPIAQQDLLEYRRRSNPLGTFFPEDETLYDNRMLNSFDYTGSSEEKIIERTRSYAAVIHKTDGGTERLMFGTEHTAHFSCSLLQVHGEFSRFDTGYVQIGIVTEGVGRILCEDEAIEVKQGDELFFPKSAVNIKMEGQFTILLCNPGMAKYC